MKFGPTVKILCRYAHSLPPIHYHLYTQAYWNMYQSMQTCQPIHFSQSSLSIPAHKLTHPHLFSHKQACTHPYSFSQTSLNTHKHPFTHSRTQAHKHTRTQAHSHTRSQARRRVARARKWKKLEMLLGFAPSWDMNHFCFIWVSGSKADNEINWLSSLKMPQLRDGNTKGVSTIGKCRRILFYTK